MSNQQKSVIITFLGNAFQDSRVINLNESLTKINYKVTTISFDWKTENFKTITGKTSVFKLDKSRSSIIYYFKFMFILIRELLRVKGDIYFAEDIYTLPFVYFFAKINKAKLFYNSREIYTHIGGLRNKTFAQRVISLIESKFIKKVDLVLVTGEMDAEYLTEAYSISNLLVLRNLPKYQFEYNKVDLHKLLKIPRENKIILYQGVILEGRGILKIAKILNRFPNINFVIIGDGEFKKNFEEEINKLSQNERVHFLGAVNHNELLNYTASADVGIALIENISISYYYALPNKLFEYIMAGVPVLASDLPQMKKIVDEYNVGKYINPDNEDELIETISEMISNNTLRELLKSNCYKAAKELNWETEFRKIKKYLV